MSGTLSTTTDQANVEFDEIPNDWRVPGSYTEVKPVYTNTTLFSRPSRILIMGQALATGYTGRIVNVTQPSQADAYWGAGSMVSCMVKAALLANPYTPIDVFAVPDAQTSTKASGTVVLGGQPAQATTAYFQIGTETIAYPVDPATAASAWAASLVAAVNADPNVEVVATQGTAGAAATVTFTAKHAGLCGNDIYLSGGYRDDQVVPGLTATVTAMAGGSGNPNITTIFAAIARSLYSDMIVPWTDSQNLAALATELNRRYNAMVKLDAHAYLAFNQGYGALCTTGPAQNCKHQTPMGSTGRPTPPYTFAAIAGAVGAYNMAQDPSRQLRGLPLIGLLPPRDADQFDDDERNQLLHSGISTTLVLPDGTEVIERLITSYQETAEGVVDDAWLDIMVPKTMTAIRYDWNSYITATYPRAKLADDGSVAAIYDSSVMTPSVAKGSWAARSRLYEQQGWIEDVAGNATQAAFVRDASDRNRLNTKLPVRVIGALMIMANSLEFEV
ncbi:phage tail sheath subtilisin-like domain-containing protein [Acidisoma sp. 7E03]